MSESVAGGEAIELSDSGVGLLKSAIAAATELASITPESWQEGIEALGASVEKFAATLREFPDKARSIRDELNRIYIIEEPQFDLRTADLGGMPPVAQIAASEGGTPSTLAGWVGVLRESLHKLAPELEGSDFGLTLSKLLAGVDKFDALAPLDLSSLEMRKAADGVTNGTDLPGEQVTAGENVVITPDLDAGGKLVAAQGSGKGKKKPGGPFEKSRFGSNTLRTLSKVELRSRDAELHKLLSEDAGGGDGESAVDVAHNAVIAEMSRREMKHAGVSKAWHVVKLLKADQPEEERYILGVVLEPNDGDRTPLAPDAQKDIYSLEDVRQTAHDFLAEYQQIGLMHEELISRGVRILESYIAPCDFEAGGQKVLKGSWLLALRILTDQVWQDIKSGKLTGFSIGGDARRTPVEI